MAQAPTNNTQATPAIVLQLTTREQRWHDCKTIAKVVAIALPSVLLGGGAFALAFFALKATLFTAIIIGSATTGVMLLCGLVFIAAMAIRYGNAQATYAQATQAALVAKETALTAKEAEMKQSQEQATAEQQQLNARVTDLRVLLDQRELQLDQTEQYGVRALKLMREERDTAIKEKQGLEGLYQARVRAIPTAADNYISKFTAHQQLVAKQQIKKHTLSVTGKDLEAALKEVGAAESLYKLAVQQAAQPIPQ
jgi:hypothetical protein